MVENGCSLIFSPIFILELCPLSHLTHLTAIYFDIYILIAVFSHAIHLHHYSIRVYTLRYGLIPLNNQLQLNMRR